ncbi:uncharacterized protein B0H64DRAFT_371898 [Chaetomium fimeti]|uniref:Uncharacterized protein n=1 Tax=Chaetomium fimeti TaxID=1854472 RepID=A0AAE0LWT4_9PEZI|nr:hypothetical protein B0H64DRAFT_371898 [Chaetomium fimeti]
MKAVSTILLTLATLAFAAPNPNANADTLSTRQNQLGCTYDCQCQDGFGDVFVPINEECCQSDISEDGKNCNIPFHPLAQIYAGCCKLMPGRPVCLWLDER